MPHTDPPEPEKHELIIVHYGCGCVKKRYQLKVDDANYPEPTEIRLDGDCWRCEERVDREGAAAAAAAAEVARRRRAGLRGRLRGMFRGRARPSISRSKASMASSKPSKIVTISYDKETYESLPRCIQKHVTEEQWAEMQQEYDERKSAQDEEYNSRAGILTLEDLDRQEQERRDAQPRYKDSKSALQAMKQYLKSRPPLPTVGSGESVREHHARVRKHFGMRRMAEVETAMASDDAGNGHHDEGGNVKKAVSKGTKMSGVVGGSTRGSGSKAHEEEDGWVIIPTTIVKSKCRDGGLSQIESESEFDEEWDEESAEEDDNEEEALRSIAGPAPRH